MHIFAARSRNDLYDSENKKKLLKKKRSFPSWKKKPTLNNDFLELIKIKRFAAFVFMKGRRLFQNSLLPNVD